MSNAPRPPAGPPQPYMPFSPQTPPQAKKGRSLANLIKLVLMGIGAIVVACAGLSAILKATGYVSPTQATQTAILAQAPGGLSASIGEDTLPVASQSSSVPTIAATAQPSPTVPPTTTETRALLSHAPMKLGTWKVSLIDVATETMLGNDQGTWVVVHGTIFNEGEDDRIGIQELKLRAGARIIELDRNASEVVADTYHVTDIGHWGGEKIKAGESLQWAIAFDVPSMSDELTFMVNDQPGPELGDVITLAGLPTLTPRPTRVPMPSATPRATKTPAPTPVQLTITLARGGNMRRWPGTGYGITHEFAPNASVLIITRRDEHGERWYEVQLDGKLGWISGTLVDGDPAQLDTLPQHQQMIPPPPTATPAPTAKPQPTARPATNSGQRIGAMCQDGTRSTATGSGACSHHGGVAYWILAP